MLEFPGILLTLSQEAAIVRSEQPLLTLSSTVIGGGFISTQVIINRHVPLNYNCADPASGLQQFAQARNCADPFVGFLTGVPIHGTRHVTLHQDELTVTSIITAGVSNAEAAGLTRPVASTIGTINMIILIDANLTPAAMVNAIITATEAKTAILTQCSVYSADGYPATGTSTDAIVIACTQRGEELPYAGPVTSVGYLIGKSVRQCLLQALEPCNIFPGIPQVSGIPPLLNIPQEEKIDV